MRHILSTSKVSNILFFYRSIITRILQHFRVPPCELIYKEPTMLRKKAIITLGFHRRNGEWIQTTSIKNHDTLVVPKDDRVLNDVYSADHLTRF